LSTLHGTPIPGTARTFKLNWAAYGSAKPGQTMGETEVFQAPQEYTLFIDKLDRNVNDAILYDLFAKKYSSLMSAKVITDPLSRRSKCYGFLKFSENDDCVKAHKEMDGQSLLGKFFKLSIVN